MDKYEKVQIFDRFDDIPMASIDSIEHRIKNFREDLIKEARQKLKEKKK